MTENTTTDSKSLTPLYGKQVELDPSISVAVAGAAGKMGTRVSNNLNLTDAPVYYVEASEPGRERLADLGREVTDLDEAARNADVVILAVPDVVLGKVSAQVVPLMKDGSLLLTLDPAAAYAGLLTERTGVHQACAHPAHPSIFLERTTPEEWADTFGGIAAPQEVVAAYEGGDESVRERATKVIRAIYAPVIDVHWVTVKQLAQLEPTLVETTGCMIGQFLKDSMDHAINEVGIPEKAVQALFYGHIFIALTNALRGSNPFSDACLRAMDFGREHIISPDWKSVWDDAELDVVLAKMLDLDKIER
ncbi:phosphogluconate dehydrogenase C-terminal domain-containing protein [Naumannella halotolerans]|uniref:Acetohydroxy acid isomeroreductase-like protein n=1 Tax=Naumannella halotolerans TaxID=993414 RepID=A0A4R7JAR3_9ACTN|nr:phosphogluconate dehydrogenase C-terminal domain-containing protein [Naumannella halotolerans]TDT33727.1 acetohydroxy acid isomeroreductase-like protein [Naumannella halotolerans]